MVGASTRAEAAETPPGPCPSCGTQRLGRYCHACGERRLDPARDHSLRWLISHIAEGLLQLDSKLLRSFAALLLRPGKLTRDVLDGRRQPYLQPLPLFLTTSLLFYLCFDKAYAAPIETLQANFERGGWLGNVLGCDLRALLARKAAAAAQDPTVIAARVWERAAQESKLFLGLLVPPLAVLLQLFYWRRQPRFVPHVIAAVHLFVLFLLLDLAFLGVCRLRGMDRVNDTEFLPLFAAFALHAGVALRRVYGGGLAAALFRGAALASGLTVLIVVYRQIVTIAVAWLL